jgi:hypothetical protein
MRHPEGPRSCQRAEGISLGTAFAHPSSVIRCVPAEFGTIPSKASSHSCLYLPKATSGQIYIVNSL